MPEAAPWKLLLWTALAGLIFGLIGFGEIAEDWLRVARNSFHKHNASGDIVILTIDDKSLPEVGNWPWPRRTDAQLVDRLTAAGAKRIYFDVNFSFVSNPVDDNAFADAIKAQSRVTLFTALEKRPNGCGAGRRRPSATHAPATRQPLRPRAFFYNYQNAVWHVPYAAALPHGTIPSFAAAIANAAGPATEDFPGRLFHRSAHYPFIFRRRHAVGRALARNNSRARTC